MLRSVLCLPFFPISKIDRHPKSLTLLCCLLCLPPFFSHFQNRRSLPVPFAHLLRLVQFSFNFFLLKLHTLHLGHPFPKC
ncbi:hypothetical protein E1A91_D06G103400v1 [Gossypium mustelinum]|uniref:Uncharacterized protein n=2 Tax=Gossypium TaxID=3633 RepID=A0A5J5R0C1_GOSBA|nr:hypothetical protein ES319_D06G101400v1 [Gossypium barbadense]TYI76816.1 hypothetical protein E1A91_D06G103400v1 [Gossypium mustelinum]